MTGSRRGLCASLQDPVTWAPVGGPDLQGGESRGESEAKLGRFRAARAQGQVQRNRDSLCLKWGLRRAPDTLRVRGEHTRREEVLTLASGSSS